MSDLVSVLHGASYDGYCRVAELGLRGMITVRGDLAAPGFVAAVTKVAGCGMPGVRNIVTADAHSLAWMSPDELLLMLPYQDVAGALGALETALSGQHSLVLDVSDARACFRVEGVGCREVFAKLAPVDLHPENFGPGDFRRTRLAQVPAAFWMPTDKIVDMFCFRSVAKYVFDLLSVSTRPGGQVGYPPTGLAKSEST